jgi:hypothetical protein
MFFPEKYRVGLDCRAVISDTGSVHSALENRMTPEGLPRLVAGVSGVTNEEGRPRANG